MNYHSYQRPYKPEQGTNGQLYRCLQQFKKEQELRKQCQKKQLLKYLDDIADVWDMQDKNDLQDIIAGKPAPWEKESKTD